jgi:hypothetical protein
VDKVIKFENGMLVLNSVFSKEDVTQINEFADHVRNQERKRIIKLLTEDGKLNYISEYTYDYVVSVIQGTDEELGL